jgi:hypothetical protein
MLRSSAVVGLPPTLKLRRVELARRAEQPMTRKLYTKQTKLTKGEAAYLRNGLGLDLA